MEALRKLVERWPSEGVLELPPESESAVRAAFSSVGGQATEDLLELYAQIGGMGMMDNSYFRLWPLSEVKQENVPSSSHGTLFADYLIDSWRYRVKPVSKTQSAVYVDFYDNKPPKLVANSIKDFLALCLTNPDVALHQPGGASSDA
jgi:hypothetical protein